MEKTAAADPVMTTPRAFPATLQCQVEYGENGDLAFFFSRVDIAGQTALADLRERFRYSNDGVRIAHLKRDATGVGIKELCLIIPRR